MKIALKNLARVWVGAIVIGLLSACGGANDQAGNASPSAAANNSARALPSFLPTTDMPPSARTMAIQIEGGRLNSEELAQTAKTGVPPKPFDGPLLSGAGDLSKSIGNNSASVAPSFQPRLSAQIRAASLAQAYRFYNPRTTAHFFTTNTVERANIIANLPFINDEGPAFFTSNAMVTGLSPVHRLYNRQTGVHFFTISEGERAKVAAELPEYTYEGIAYYASQLAGAGLTPLYRFYYASKGFHFFTSNIVERDRIIATLPNYTYEGVGYYVMNSDWQATDGPGTDTTVPNTGGTTTSCVSPQVLQGGVCVTSTTPTKTTYQTAYDFCYRGTPTPTASVTTYCTAYANAIVAGSTPADADLAGATALTISVTADRDGGPDGSAEGSAGDGAPIANAQVVLTDKAGNTRTTTTDAIGYYRINLKGTTPPYVVKVTRSDGTVWYSGSAVGAPDRGFVTMNLTGLTDKVMGYVSDSANLFGGAAAVTPAVLQTNASTLQASKTRIATALTSPLTYVGLNPSTFDPISDKYVAVKADNYDRLLERLTASKSGADGRTVVVGTFAGVKESFIDGPSTVATFDNPSGAAVDSSGNVYVADTRNHAIRKISPAGVVSTLAGSGNKGFTNGTGTAATFAFPQGIALDASGNVYVADTLNHAIRKISPAGVVSTLAGSGSYGFTNGTGTAATFFNPAGVATDASGNVYVGDSSNDAIRKISPAGVVSTLAGGSFGFTNGTGAAATFAFPQGVALDASGNVYVADSFNSAIRKITPAGVVSTLAGGNIIGFSNGTGTAAQFQSSYGVALDASGNVYVADTSSNAVHKITPAGVVSTLAGGGSRGFTNSTGTAATFNQPTGVATDVSGNVYVTDNLNNAVRKITPTGVVSTLAGSGNRGFTNGTGTAATFAAPSGVATDASGNVYVADSGNNAIRKITPAGVVSTLAGGGNSGFTNGTGTAATFNRPSGVALDASGNVYVADSGNHAVRKITPAGVVSTLAGGGNRGFTNGAGTAATFNRPAGVATDASGNVYVADSQNSAIRKITPTGVVSTLAGSGSLGFTNGTGTAATFAFPVGVATDASGNVYVGDSYNNAVRKITPTGVVSTLAGSGTSSFGFTNGTGTAATFNYPSGVALDASGNVYVVDSLNNAIRKITPAGVVSTVSGDGSIGYRNDSSTGARFNGPSGVAVQSNGNVYVGDTGNNAIRLILP